MVKMKDEEFEFVRGFGVFDGDGNGRATRTDSVCSVPHNNLLDCRFVVGVSSPLKFSQLTKFRPHEQNVFLQERILVDRYLPAETIGNATTASEEITLAEMQDGTYRILRRGLPLKDHCWKSSEKDWRSASVTSSKLSSRKSLMGSPCPSGFREPQCRATTLPALLRSALTPTRLGATTGDGDAVRWFGSASRTSSPMLHRHRCFTHSVAQPVAQPPSLRPPLSTPSPDMIQSQPRRPGSG